MKNSFFLEQEEIFTDFGFNDSQVLEMRKRFGKNELTPPKREPWWRQFLEKFEDPTIRILLAAAVVSLLMTCLEKYLLRHPEASFVDSVGIFLAVFLATVVGYFSEWKSAREFELLNKVKDDIPVKVLRNGQLAEIPIADVVVGDIVRIDMGDKIPADGVLIDTLGLLVDQSLLTGESVAVEKKAYHGNGNLAPTWNSNRDGNKKECHGGVEETMRVARGTMVMDGHGEFVVTAVGDATQMGEIAETLKENPET
ncbi:MAG: cation-transporting P-type ATPase, partial [Planctomycetaceae bacterium]|nr:cation-transporting P-type ATPase [Planctomycetaceae bacterium]